jgi:transcriptional antiterminator NusG
VAGCKDNCEDCACGFWKEEWGLLEKWYAVFVKTGDEEEVKKRIELFFGNEIKAYNPRRELIERKEGKLRKVEKVLFPGYIFLNGCLSSQIIDKLRNVPNIYSLLKEENEPAVIQEDEIMVFKHLMIEDVIEISDILVENDTIIVVNGPLLSLKGRLIKIDKRKGRAKVSINLLGEERVVDLGINIIQKV